MTPEDYTKIIHDKIIDDLRLLTYADGTSKVFGAVDAHFITNPDTSPFAEVMPTDFSVEIDGYSEDTRFENFDVYVWDVLESSSTDADAKTKIQRISTIKGILMDYISKIPSRIEYPAVNIHIYNAKVSNGQIAIVTIEQGIAVALSISFELKVYVNARLIV